jgi:hypothetical protein
MQLPILAPAPLVATHAEAFRDLFENRCQIRHFENYLTGLMVLPNKSMANIARCLIESSDKTNISRYFSKDRWEQEQINDRRVRYVLKQTKHVRLAKERSGLILDDTLCEHVGTQSGSSTSIIITIMVTTPIRWHTIRSPVIMSAGRCGFRWICGCIVGMKK